MYLGKERRNRFVALGLAAVLVAGVVLALLATMAVAAPAVGGDVSTASRHTATGALGTVNAASSTAPAAGHHESVDPAELASAGTAHPTRLVGVLVAVALVLTCGVMVVHEQRRRRSEQSPTR